MIYEQIPTLTLIKPNPFPNQSFTWLKQMLTCLKQVLGSTKMIY